MALFFECLLDFALGCLKYYSLYVLVIGIWKLYLCIKNHVISKFWPVDLKTRFGEWAVVTGCTDGIGKAYCHELAKRGINLILISRTWSKLQNVSSDIKIKYGVETEIIQADFSKGPQIYEDLKRQLETKKNIGMLVNNVGVIIDQPKSFDRVTNDEMWGHVLVNMGAPTAMAKIILPSMIANKRGAIINLSSMSSMNPMPYIGIYSASKVYNYYFSKALKVEMEKHGIYVQTVTPHYISTSMVQFSEDMSKPSLLVPTAEKFAAEAVSTIGYSNDTCGYYVHELWAIVLCIFPEWLKIKLSTKFQENLMRKMKK